MARTILVQDGRKDTPANREALVVLAQRAALKCVAESAAAVARSGSLGSENLHEVHDLTQAFSGLEIESKEAPPPRAAAPGLVRSSPPREMEEALERAFRVPFKADGTVDVADALRGIKRRGKTSRRAKKQRTK